MTHYRAAYIDSGKFNGFYTLRTVVAGPGFYNDQYIKTLSRDWGKAFVKYEKFLEVSQREQLTGEGDEFMLNEWGMGGSQDWSIAHYHRWKIQFERGVMPFGKHTDTKVSDLTPGYRLWLRDLATKKVAAGNKNLAKTWQLALDALKPYEAEYAETIANKEKRAKEIEAKKAKSKHVGEIKKRIIKTLTCEAKWPYESDFGGGEISLLRDEEGNTLKTFGVCAIGKGETKTVKFTIKDHQEYKGEKQTLINRLMVQ